MGGVNIGKDQTRKFKKNQIMTRSVTGNTKKTPDKQVEQIDV